MHEIPQKLGLGQNINTEENNVTFLSGATVEQVLKNLQYQYPPENLNLADTTKWLFMIPISYIFPNMSKLQQNIQVPINCVQVEFPAFKIGTTNIGYMGYTFDVSTGQNLTDKGLTVTYLCNSNWLQYLLLLKWFEMEDRTAYSQFQSSTSNTNQNNEIDDSDWKSPFDTGKDLTYSNYGPQIPCYLYLLDNFHNRIITILFQNCWLTEVSKVSLDMTKNSGTEVKGTFQLKFSKYSISVNNDYLKSIVGNGISNSLL